MRALGGEDLTSMPPSAPPSSLSNSLASSSSLVSSNDRHVINSLELPADADEEDAASEREAQLAAADWALERESELARLEQENAFLRSLAAEHLSQPSSDRSSSVPPELPRLSSLPRVSARTNNGKLGGRDVGPYGMYKKFEE